MHVGRLMNNAEFSYKGNKNKIKFRKGVLRDRDGDAVPVENKTRFVNRDGYAVPGQITENWSLDQLPGYSEKESIFVMSEDRFGFVSNSDHDNTSFEIEEDKKYE